MGQKAEAGGGQAELGPGGSSSPAAPASCWLSHQPRRRLAGGLGAEMAGAGPERAAPTTALGDRQDESVSKGWWWWRSMGRKEGKGCLGTGFFLSS